MLKNSKNVENFYGDEIFMEIFFMIVLESPISSIRCTIQISTHDTAQSFGQFGEMVKCSFTN